MDTIHTISDVKNLKDYKNIWESLTRFSNNPLLSYDWFLSCAETFYSENDILIVIYKKNNTIDGIAPLAKIKNNPVLSYEILGSSLLYEPSGLIYKDKESLKELIKGILGLRSPLFLNRISDQKVVDHFSNHFTSHKILFRKFNTKSCWIDTKGSWIAFTKNMSGRRRYDLRRAKKRAEAKGTLNSEIILPSLKNLGSLLENATQIEARSWKGRQKSALLQKPQLLAFFTNYLTRLVEKGKVRIAFLSIDNIKIAMLIGIIDRNVFWILKIGYDEEWAQCSPGILLINDTIQYAFEQKLERYEFIGMYENWQKMWPVNVREYTSLVYYPVSFKALMLLGIDLGKYLMKRFIY